MFKGKFDNFHMKWLCTIWVDRREGALCSSQFTDTLCTQLPTVNLYSHSQGTGLIEETIDDSVKI